MEPRSWGGVSRDGRWSSALARLDPTWSRVPVTSGGFICSVLDPRRLRSANRCSRRSRRSGRPAAISKFKSHRPANVAAAAIPGLASCFPMGRLWVGAHSFTTPGADGEQPTGSRRSSGATPEGDDIASTQSPFRWRNVRRAERPGALAAAFDISSATAAERSVGLASGGRRRGVPDRASGGVDPGRCGCGSGPAGFGWVGVEAKAAGPSVSITHFGTPLSGALGIAAGPDGALWFTNDGNDRSGGSRPAARSPPTATRASAPRGIVAGPDGALWFTNKRQQLDRADHHQRDGHQLHRHRHQQPGGITAGPDGALWFTNHGNARSGGSPPRATVTNFTGAGISDPTGIAAGPGRRPVVHQRGQRSIGRITTAGAVTNFTDAEHRRPDGDHAGPDGALWFTNRRQRLDRADHHRRGGHQLHRREHQTTRTGSRPGPDGALWFTNTGSRLDRADHHRRRRHHLHRHRHRAARRGSPPGPTAPCGSPTSGNDSIGRITTAGVVTNYTGTRHQRAAGIAAGPDGALWFTNTGNDSIGRITTAGTSPTTRGTGISDPSGIAAGPDGALWFTNSGNDSIGRITTDGDDHQLHGPPASAARAGSRPGPTARSGSPTSGNDSIGRITTARHGHHLHRHAASATRRDRGRARRRPLVHQRRRNDSIGRITTDGTSRNYTDASIRQPVGITAGPDGALWFTNIGNNSIGRITTAARHQLHGREHQRSRTGSPPGPTAPSGSPTAATLDRADHHRAARHQLHRPEHQRPDGIAPGPDGALWFTNDGNDSIGRARIVARH